MERLSASDYAAIVDFLEDLYRVRDAESFTGWLVRALGELLGSNQASWNRMLPALGRAEVRSHPQPGEAHYEDLVEGFQRHLLEHPCIRHHLQTGSPGPLMISDFLSAVSFKRLGLYDAVYRLLDVEDQIGFTVGRYGGDTIAVAVSRDRRSFGERERALLSTLRPHISRAWDNARAISRWHSQPAGAGPENAQCVLFLDERNQPRELPRIAAHWLGEHFGATRALARGALPAEVTHWLLAEEAAASEPLVHSRAGNRLVIRRLLEPGSPRPTNVLLLERRALAEGADYLRSRGLTRREIEVLDHLEQGLTNEEISVRLHTSPLTVKKHLERIYRKLGVRNRTEAVKRGRRG